MRERMFTEGERAYAETANDPTERYAARFAAKEAVMKAMGVGLGAFGFHDVEVLREEGGRPSLRVIGAAEPLAVERGVQAWQISPPPTATSAGRVGWAAGAVQ